MRRKHTSIFSKIIELIKKLIYAFRTMSFVKHILLFYLVITIVGSLLLFMPASHNSDVSFVDALFTAASAFSDTGLTSLNTAQVFNILGQAIIAVLIFIGGIGWFALKVYFFNIILGKPMSFISRDALSAERGSSKVGFTKHIIKVSVSILLISLAIATVILTLLFFYLEPNANPYNLNGAQLNKGFDGKDMVWENPSGSFITAFRFGIFHAISALNNAGFDIVGGNSVAPYYHVYYIQIMFMILFIIGGIGYPVFYDLHSLVHAKRNKMQFKWSLFTKLSTITYTIVALLGILATFLVETTSKDTPIFDVDGTPVGQYYSFWNNPMYGSTGDRTMALIFNSLSTRSAGFSTIRAADLSPITSFIFAVLMFIGSAPSSTGGGIRTTTFALVVIGLWNKIRGRDEVRAFNRRIDQHTVNRSYIIFALAVALIAITSLVGYTSFATVGGVVNSNVDNMFLANTQNGFVHVPYNLNELVYEVSSAFGTTGLSAGLTHMISLPTKILLILLMFIGQLGVSSSILIWRAKSPKSKSYNYVEEDVTIG